MSLFRRMALLVVAALAVAAVLFTPTAAAYIFPATPVALTTMVERSAHIEAVTADAAVRIMRPRGSGTAFHIGGGRIITAAHVVVGAKVVSLKDQTGHISSANVVSIDEKTDLAILQTAMRLPAADLSCGTVPVGTTISAIGNPLGQEFISSFGRIAGSPRTVGDIRTVYITDMTVVMGQSGGPVFADGHAIGVMSAVMVAPMKIPGTADKFVPSLVGFGYVVPSSLVCEMIAKLDAANGETA